MNELGINVATKDLKKLRTYLERLKTTYLIEGGGMYREDRDVSKLHLTTTWTEEELGDWLYYRAHGCKYFGTFVREG